MSETRQSWLSRLRGGLSKSANKIGDSISGVFTKRRLDDEALEELEEALIAGDFGVQTSAKISAKLASDKFDKEVSDEEVRQAVADHIAQMLEPVTEPILLENASPCVILVVGVNGNGKTTTIGKLAHYFQQEGKSVMLAAADTFRAAAVEQLSVWGERNHCPVMTPEQQGGDAASVAYRAYEKARETKTDVLLIDTAGRLQNKKNLMAELEKIIRVLKKLDEKAPHSVIQILDATTGQNALSQVETFREMVGVTGLIVTKLDGTAKGGIVVSLAEKFALPIHAIGVGEGIDDMKPFAAHDYASALMGLARH